MFYFYAHLQIKFKEKISYHYEPGAQFEEFIPYLKGIKKAGFLTNKGMGAEDNDGHYLQAQYLLAPTILDLNNSNYKLNLLDYTNQIYIFYMLKNLKAKPIKDNIWGKVLTQRNL
ncbi:MAG: hypothetical protein KC733_09635 [Candidatus Omnitrophica bacterium]|nr:hypothetical protein [Candidatus Omnitrophota bacterium]